jgi:hypothetical protein
MSHISSDSWRSNREENKHNYARYRVPLVLPIISVTLVSYKKLPLLTIKGSLMETMGNLFFLSKNIRRQKRFVECLLTLLVVFMFGCASVPKGSYRAYTGEDSPDTSLALLEIGRAGSVQIDGMYYIEGSEYSMVKLMPGSHRIEWTKLFGISVMVDPRGIVAFELKETIILQAGHIYKLRADRTHGHGYRVYMWIEDTSTGSVVVGNKMP